MQLGCWSPSAKKANRHARSCTASGPLRGNIFNLGGDNEAPHAWPDETAMRGGHASVSREDRHDN
jgi:hypothetical protein